MTPDLRAKRAGKLSASKAAIIMGGLDTSGLAGLIRDLAYERVHGPLPDGYQSQAMLNGKTNEQEALAWYEFECGEVLDIDPDRTLIHPKLAFVCATPDALRRDRCVEAKSPEHRAWMDVKKARKVPSEYRWQGRWQMWVRGVDRCDFVVWHPSLGGIIVPFNVTAAECTEMEERAHLVNRKSDEWVHVMEEA
jgi:predicted phage-related endonuclease